MLLNKALQVGHARVSELLLKVIWLLMGWSSYSILKQHLISCHILFMAQYPERYRENFRWEPFEAKHPTKYENRFIDH